MNIDAAIKQDLTPPISRNSNNNDSNDTLRSEDTLEIISRKYGFLENWALLFFLLVLLILLICTWFVQYPDIIESKAILTADNAPKEVLPLQQGRLIKLFVRNDEHVKKGQVIGFIESTANHYEILDLATRLDSSILLLNEGRTEQVSKQFNKYYGHLGELQTNYQDFIKTWQQFNDYLVNGFFYQKKKLLQNDISYLYRINETIIQQKKLSEQDVALAEESFDMNNLLANDKVISKEELRKEKSQFINKQLTIPQLNASILANETQRNEKQKEINEIEHDISQQKVIFEQSLHTLKSMVDDWIKKYILSAPLPGKIIFTVPLQENQFLQAGKVIGFVNPQGTSYYAQTYLSQTNFGKIDIGQQVQLRLAAYPYEEYGYISGRLRYVSKVPSDSGFLAIIDLNKELITSHHYPIQFKNGLEAKTIIITRNMRLLERFYYGLVRDLSPQK
jgi:HlyD family secretion protein